MIRKTTRAATAGALCLVFLAVEAVAQEPVHDATATAKLHSQLNELKKQYDVLKSDYEAAMEYYALAGAVVDKVRDYSQRPEMLANELTQCVMPALPNISIPSLPNPCAAATWVSDELFYEADEIDKTNAHEKIAFQTKKRKALLEDAAVRGYGLALKMKSDAQDDAAEMALLAADLEDPQSENGIRNGQTALLVELLAEQKKTNLALASMLELWAGERVMAAGYQRQVAPAAN